MYQQPPPPVNYPPPPGPYSNPMAQQGGAGPAPGQPGAWDYGYDQPPPPAAQQMAPPPPAGGGGSGPPQQMDDGYAAPPPPAPPPPSSKVASVPEEVAEYLRFFKRSVMNQKVQDIFHLCEFGFTEMTEKYFKEKFWPNEGIVAQIVGTDFRIFIILYKELYYRYVYAKLTRGPSLEHRFSSYHNYQDFFLAILDSETPLQLLLPNQWIWDIVDEFIYQFQSFCQYKANPTKRNPEDLEELMQMQGDVWNLYPVLNILYQVIAKSQINEQLAIMNAGGKAEDVVVDDFGRHPLYYKFGYFSLIGLLRIHILLGDYNEALRTVENVKFGPGGLYNTVPTCLVALHYYVGFARMMMRDYQEATRLFVNCLLFIQRLKQTQRQVKTWQYDVVSKTNDQIFHLLSICMTLAPQRIDESVHSQLAEKHSERMNRMAKGELNEFEHAFQMGCPKFLAPTASNLEGTGPNFAKEPTLQQSRIFMEEIREQQWIPVLRGYLKLYTSIPLGKLADFTGKSEEELVSALLSFKHKLFDVTKEEEEAGEDDTTADLDFYIDKEMVHIADTKVGRRYGEYFIRHIQKLMELNKNLKKLDVGRKQAGKGGAQAQPQVAGDWKQGKQ